MSSIQRVRGVRKSGYSDRVISFSLAFVLLHAMFPVFSAAAHVNPLQEIRFAKKVKASVVGLGTGPQARVFVTLRDKSKLKGFISATDTDSFLVTDFSTGRQVSVPYSQVSTVRGQNLTSRQQFLIGLGVVAVLIVLVFVAVASDKS